MFRIVSLSCAGFALLIGLLMSAGPASAVVYCSAVGVPRGCVVRPVVVAPVVVAPVVVAPVGGPVVVCKNSWSSQRLRYAVIARSLDSRRCRSKRRAL